MATQKDQLDMGGISMRWSYPEVFISELYSAGGLPGSVSITTVTGHAALMSLWHGKAFCLTGLLWGESTEAVFFVVGLMKMLHKQHSCQWFEMLWCSIVMAHALKNVNYHDANFDVIDSTWVVIITASSAASDSKVGIMTTADFQCYRLGHGGGPVKSPPNHHWFDTRYIFCYLFVLVAEIGDDHQWHCSKNRVTNFVAEIGKFPYLVTEIWSYPFDNRNSITTHLVVLIGNITHLITEISNIAEIVAEIVNFSHLPCGVPICELELNNPSIIMWYERWPILEVIPVQSLLYPRPTKLEGGYTGFTLSVRLSVRPSVCL